MKRRGIARATGVVLLVPALLGAGPIIHVYPSIGPNPFLSPSWEAYARNAVSALQAGSTSHGTPGSPSYYRRQWVFYPGEVISTTFESWKGEAPPPPGYAGEYGNALVMGLYLSGGGQTFYLKDLWFQGEFFGVPATFSFAGEPYGYDLVGHYYGADRVPGNADDIWYHELNPGSDSVPVDRIWFSGITGSFWVTDPAQLPSTIAAIWSSANPYATGGYCIWIDGQYFCGGATAWLVPEPASLWLVALGLLGLVRLRRARSS